MRSGSDWHLHCSNCDAVMHSLPLSQCAVFATEVRRLMLRTPTRTSSMYRLLRSHASAFSSIACFTIPLQQLIRGAPWYLVPATASSTTYNRVTTNLENLEYPGIFTNMENSGNYQGILCNLVENF